MNESLDINPVLVETITILESGWGRGQEASKIILPAFGAGAFSK